MENPDRELRLWTSDQIANGRRYVEAWARGGVALEKIRRDELRGMDVAKAVALLCGPADYHSGPRAARPSSGLVEQQRWFVKAAGRD